MQSQAKSSAQDRSAATVGTLLFHGAFALLLILGMRSCGSGEGDGIQYMALNVAALGEPDGGSTDAPENPNSAAAASPQSSEATQDDVATQDDAPVEAPKTDPKPKPKPTPDPKPNPDPKPTAAENIIKGDKENKPPGGPPNNNPNPNGAPDGKIEGKGALGGGGGSSFGYSFYRPIKQGGEPKLDEEIKVAGTISVDVTVDKNGKVISAVPVSSSYVPDKGGNYSRAEVERLAIKAAKSTVFQADPDGTIPKKGRITITLKLR